jgi:hypothetical protein
MIIIDDAGTGSIVGLPIIVGIKNGKIAAVSMSDEPVVNATKETFKIIEMLEVDKSEEIRICRGKIFKNFCHEAKKLGYTIEQTKIEGEAQDIAEDVFMNSLYHLGFDETLVLQDKNYKQLFNDTVDQLFLKPDLVQHVRSHFKLNPIYTTIVYKINRLENEFPHLYSLMRGK